MLKIRTIFGLALLDCIIVFTGFPGAWKSTTLLVSLVLIVVLAWRLSLELRVKNPVSGGDTFTESHS